MREDRGARCFHRQAQSAPMAVWRSPALAPVALIQSFPIGDRRTGVHVALSGSLNVTIYGASTAPAVLTRGRFSDRPAPEFPRTCERDHSLTRTFLAIFEPGFRSESTISNVTRCPTARLCVPVLSCVTWQKISSPLSAMRNPNPR